MRENFNEIVCHAVEYYICPSLYDVALLSMEPSELKDILAGLDKLETRFERKHFIRDNIPADYMERLELLEACNVIEKGDCLTGYKSNKPTGEWKYDKLVKANFETIENAGYRFGGFGL